MQYLQIQLNFFSIIMFKVLGQNPFILGILESLIAPSSLCPLGCETQADSYIAESPTVEKTT